MLTSITRYDLNCEEHNPHKTILTTLELISIPQKYIIAAEFFVKMCRKGLCSDWIQIYLG